MCMLCVCDCLCVILAHILVVDVVMWSGKHPSTLTRKSCVTKSQQSLLVLICLSSHVKSWSVVLECFLVMEFDNVTGWNVYNH